mmetsp:Transcript_17852/g.39571  ORF Transcript_17852/g.39571 Transcript_17852/m.39571 type:complete len:95 (-) Transcript_17852:266-550(-)
MGCDIRPIMLPRSPAGGGVFINWKEEAGLPIAGPAMNEKEDPTAGTFAGASAICMKEKPPGEGEGAGASWGALFMLFMKLKDEEGTPPTPPPVT